MNATKLNRIKILIVDDSLSTLEVIQRNLLHHGYEVSASDNVNNAIEIIKKNEIDIVITDYKMPKVSGMEFLHYLNEHHPHIESIMISGFATVENAVSAMKKGAKDFIAKPFTDEELLGTVQKSVDRLHGRKLGNTSKITVDTFWGMIGTAKAMKEVFSLIEKSALSNATVLITGESGTGKELVARAVHYSSRRSSAPFIPINCAGIPENLVESELFGHMKGSFTGATESRAGFFQTADTGTIFLDEIGEIPLTMQAKLLRVLQDKEIYMLGQKRPQKVDVRVIAATNKNLQLLVEQKKFREDLYYRLNVLTIEAPPLRERENDVLILLRYFTEKFSNDLGRPYPPQYSDQALSAIQNYCWPGNVRELENTTHRCLLLLDANKEIIQVSDLPAFMRMSAPPVQNPLTSEEDLTRTLAEVESSYIHKVLLALKGNKSKAAESLGIDRKTLREKCKLA
ncbi:MAG: sigma-54-dependent Fis family transcriptional regulator [Oligoflexia bacterium]|nr:sigma-54-dependent Fis family transcriptional regulator [Oligoflexia bacterium]